MRTRLFLVTIVAVFYFSNTIASPGDTLITGTWKGTSICQVKDSPCHDEIAAYHVAKGDKPGTYRFVMNKIVNGVEEDMGITDFVYDANAGTLTYVDEARKGLWKFTVKGDSMEGVAWFRGQLYRVIKLRREK